MSSWRDELYSTLISGVLGRTNNANVNALLGVTDTAGYSITDNIGEFQTQTNLSSLLAALGIPDTLNKPLYTCLVTDRLDNAAHGLSALHADIGDITDAALGKDTDDNGTQSGIALLRSLVDRVGNVGGSDIDGLVDAVQADLGDMADGELGKDADDDDVHSAISMLKSLIDRVGNVGSSNLDALLDNIYATQPRIVSRAASALPQTTQTPYFTVTGRVLITQIVGEVTTVIGNIAATDTKLIANPTVGADVDMCALVDIDQDTVGTLYNITGTLANAMIATTSGAMQAQPEAIVVAAGTIDLDCTKSNTGETKWTLHYIPLDSGSSVVSA